MAPITIDDTEVSAITIDGEEVQEVTANGETVWTASPVEAVGYNTTGTGYIRNINTGELVQSVDTTDALSSAISENYFAVESGDTSVKVYDKDDYSLLYTLSDHSDDVDEIEVHEPHLIVAPNLTNEAYLYDLSDGSLKYQYSSPDNIDAVGVSSNYYAVSGSVQGYGYSWYYRTWVHDLSDNSEVTVKEVFDNNTHGTCLTDSHLVISRYTTYVYDVSDFSQVCQADTQAGIDVSANSEYFAVGGTDYNVGVYDITDGSTIQTLDAFTGTIRGVELSENYLVAGSDDGSCRVYNTDDWTEEYQFTSDSAIEDTGIINSV